MRESLFAYGLQIQKERNAPHRIAARPGFDTHNVPDGIALSAFSRFGDKVDGVLYNPEQGRWGGSAGSK